MSKPYIIKDKYFERAKASGYRARSIFKLEEIQQKFGVFKEGMSVLDIGAAPGSWLQYARKIVGPAAKIIGIDIKKIEPLDINTLVLEGDVLSDDISGIIENSYQGKFSVILSDLAPSTSGVKDVDHYRSIELCQRVLYLGARFLAIRGTIVLKIFQGPDFDAFIFEVRKNFRNVSIFKPKSSRDRSFEVYIILKQAKDSFFAFKDDKC